MNKISNCCSASVENGVCFDCKEPCEAVDGTKEKIQEIHETIKNLAVFIVDTKLDFNKAMNQAESQVAELHQLLKELTGEKDLF